MCILETLHKFYDEDQNKCITLPANFSDEELRINKGITICFASVVSITDAYHDAELIELINEVNNIDIEMKESAIRKVAPNDTLTLIPQNSSLMSHKDFYPKLRITLLDAQLLNELIWQLYDCLEDFSDIMSKSSEDIGLTHLEEMVLPTEPGAAPVASNPHDLPLNHHKSVKEELTNLLEAYLIERSLSP